MGANAQTSVPLFASGEVLTAANQNLSAGTGVPVFATTVTRDAAFGGAGEKVLAEGQLAYIEATDVVQYYNGTAWATLGPATSGGLVFIYGATFSAAASVSLPASTFSSTYRNYRLQLSITDNSTDDTTLALRMRSGGSDDTTGYYGTIFGTTYASDTFRVTRSNNATSFAMSTLRTTIALDQTYSFDVLNPNIATNTTWSGTAFGCAANDSAGLMFAGEENSSTQFDALSFIPGAGTITGTIRVYGYADS